MTELPATEGAEALGGLDFRLLSTTAAGDFSRVMRTSRTVDRREVHKAAVREVLLTDMVALDDRLYAVAAQWPRQNPAFAVDTTGSPHPMLFIETLRQAGIYVAHRAMGVTLGNHFVFEWIDATYDDDWGRLSRQITTTVLAIRASPQYRGSKVAGARLEVEAWTGEQRIASAHSAYRVISPAVYVRLREKGQTAGSGSRRHEVNGALVDLSREPDRSHQRRADLYVDRENATFFDHDVDHLPGVLLLDAALAAARTHLTTPFEQRPARIRMDFEQFAELTLPTVIASDARGADQERLRVDLVVEQGPVVCARGAISFRSASSAHC